MKILFISRPICRRQYQCNDQYVKMKLEQIHAIFKIFLLKIHLCTVADWFPGWGFSRKLAELYKFNLRFDALLFSRVRIEAERKFQEFGAS